MAPEPTTTSSTTGATKRTDAKDAGTERSATKSTSSGPAAARVTRSPREPADAERPTSKGTESADKDAQRGLTVTIPQPVVDVVTAPFAIAGKVLPKQKGLPVYVGLGALAVAEAVTWPAAVGIGVAYASIRRWGPGQKDTKSQE